jgi:membrane protein implicated in regulation of membrane protease activity
MGIGGSIFLIAVGAILAFAVDADLGWLSVGTVGWVLMLAGLVGLLMTAYFWRTRRQAVVAPPVQQQVVPVRDDQVVEYREVRRPGRTV